MLMVSRADSPPVTSLAMAEADGVVGIAEEAGPGTAPGPEAADEAMAGVGAGAGDAVSVGDGAEEAVGVGMAGAGAGAAGAIGAVGAGAVGAGAVGAGAVGAGAAGAIGAAGAVGAGAVGAIGAAGAVGAGAVGAGAIGAGATVGTGVALIPGTLDIATRIFTCCSFVKCKKDPFSWVILLTPSLNCFWRNAGVQSMNLLFNCISSFISVLR